MDCLELMKPKLLEEYQSQALSRQAVQQAQERRREEEAELQRKLRLKQQEQEQADALRRDRLRLINEMNEVSRKQAELKRTTEDMQLGDASDLLDAFLPPPAASKVPAPKTEQVHPMYPQDNQEESLALYPTVKIKPDEMKAEISHEAKAESPIQTSPPQAKMDSPSQTKMDVKSVVHRLESGLPLRNLSVPESIVAQFTQLAIPNTRRGIETCGVLAGTLLHDQLTITHLIIPKQHGTMDTCAMEGEEEVLDCQERYNLLTLGWIHTHPTQSCFMSSVDLHTHFAYQLMLTEAIAIVCAPSKQPR